VTFAHEAAATFAPARRAGQRDDLCRLVTRASTFDAIARQSRCDARSEACAGGTPEDVLIATHKAEYEQINEAGGLPVTVPASGRSAVLKSRIWSAKKNGPCRAVPRQPDTFECSLDMMVTLREGDNKPGKHAERVYVHWDGEKGEWKRGMPGRRK
jgi:hypothetical protein